MKRHNGFERGLGRSTFKCQSCGRMTRYTGVQSLGTGICPDCFEIAGYDNTINDNGLKGRELAENVAAAEDHLANIAAKGGDVARVKRGCDFIWGSDVKAALVDAIEGAGFTVAGPTDHRAAEHGEPAWVCNARLSISNFGA